MGILNVTPDSCYDQGKWFKVDDAIERGKQIFREGADWLDIGGESTRPGASPVSEKEEIARTLPVIRALRNEIPIPLSIDTTKAGVAAAAVKEGVRLINDVSGFSDPDMRTIAAESQLRICVMHMQGTPATMQNNPLYEQGIVPFLIDWFEERIDLLLASGVKQENIILDPGIGFGKTVADNLDILHNLHKIKKPGFPLLLGLSRKSFIGKILGKSYPDLLSGTLAMNVIALEKGVDFIRVHDVKEHKDILELYEVWSKTKSPE